MTDPISVDREFARALLASESQRGDERRPSNTLKPPPDGAELVATGERVLQRLQEHLRGWFGPDGVDALLLRALDRTRESYPFLAAVQRKLPGARHLSGLTESIGTNAGTEAESDAGEVAEGMVALIATVLALIGRLVGDEMTRHLITQVWPDIRSTDLLSGNVSNNERLGKCVNETERWSRRDVPPSNASR